MGGGESDMCLLGKNGQSTRKEILQAPYLSPWTYQGKRAKRKKKRKRKQRFICKEKKKKKNTSIAYSLVLTQNFAFE